MLNTIISNVNIRRKNNKNIKRNRSIAIASSNKAVVILSVEFVTYSELSYSYNFNIKFYSNINMSVNSFILDASVFNRSLYKL